MIKAPLLAATIESPDDLDLIDYPVLVSPKLDGVRCLTDDNGIPFTRKNELFNNADVNRLFLKFARRWPNLDGELGLGNPTKSGFFDYTSGWLRRDAGLPPEPLIFYVFDRVTADMNYSERWWNNKVDRVDEGPIRLEWVSQIICENKAEVLKWEEKFVDAGYEGIMIRTTRKNERYKHGRASLKSQELMKYKRFTDSDGVIVGFKEGMKNMNEATVDALGHTKRSSAKAGKVPNGMVGKILVKSDDFPDLIVEIGTGKGLTHNLRRDMFDNQDKYIGRKLTFWHQIGKNEQRNRPRFPSFQRFRDID